MQYLPLRSKTEKSMESYPPPIQESKSFPTKKSIDKNTFHIREGIFNVIRSVNTNMGKLRRGHFP